jgi:hypothetical protein
MVSNGENPRSNKLDSPAGGGIIGVKVGKAGVVATGVLAAGVMLGGIEMPAAWHGMQHPLYVPDMSHALRIT